MEKDAVKNINAEFHSVWDGGCDIESACKVNTETKEVFDIEKEGGNILDSLDCLDEEYIILNQDYGNKIPVFEKDDENRGKDDYWYRL